MPEKWQEYFIEGDRRTHFIVMPKNIRLFYTKYVKYVYVDFDFYPTKYQISNKGQKAFWQLYREVANKKSNALIGRLTGRMKIPKDKLDYTITKLMEILTANIEEDPELKKFTEEFGGFKELSRDEKE